MREGEGQEPMREREGQEPMLSKAKILITGTMITVLSRLRITGIRQYVFTGRITVKIMSFVKRKNYRCCSRNESPETIH